MKLLYDCESYGYKIKARVKSETIVKRSERWCDLIINSRITFVAFVFQPSQWIDGRLSGSFTDVGPRENIEMSIYVLVWFEHQLSHLLAYLWGFVTMDRPNEPILGVHGSLYRCATKEFFAHDTSVIIDLISDPNSLSIHSSICSTW